MQSQFSAVQNGTWPQFGYTIDYLVVAGGGGGGHDDGGGGGAGGYRASGYGPSPLQGRSLFLSPGPYTVTVGAGGEMEHLILQ